jgi:hypothetical protein
VGRREVLQSHVEALMAEVLEVGRARVDARGAVPVHCEGVPLSVRLRPGGGGDHIEAYSVAVADVALDPGLLEELNALNRRMCRVRTFWVDEAVVVAGEVDAVRATRHDLDDLCDEVVHWVRAQAPRLAEKDGGHAPEGVDEEDEE